MRTLPLALAIIIAGCTADHPDAAGDVAPPASPGEATRAVGAALRVDTVLAPAGLRPQAMSDAGTLWGLLRGRLARAQLDSGTVTPLEPIVWDAVAGPGAIAWRNGTGTWLWRDGNAPERIAEATPIGEFDGPPDVLFSPDGQRALLSWRAEWALHHELLDAGGERRPLAVRMPGYMAHAALLWLDDARILFSATATGPVGGTPEYRESGWRTDLAVLDLAAGSFERVTAVPDGTFLRAAGTYRGDVLVTEYDAHGPRRQWRYDPKSWQRRATTLPAGRTFARDDILIVLIPLAGDSARAILADHDTTIVLGTVAQSDEAPAFAPDGRTAVLRVGAGTAARLLRIRAP